MGERLMNELSEDILRLEDRINSRDDDRQATDAFVAEMRNGKTVRKTKSDEGKLKNWLFQQNEEREGRSDIKKEMSAPTRKRKPAQPSRPFTEEEIDMLYQKGLLGGGKNAKSLSNTVFLNNSMYFGMRSRTEHEHLRWGDVGEEGAKSRGGD
ncbi:unnamed protein product [Mytilus coruscus]|uniref:Uncharacterized protein n=1 Tax=Mytilus coruscus TaxID=42192 RepID=A0A6J8ET17_MYTCO|nr:unnamed protein product [Mytilus coruscus]